MLKTRGGELFGERDVTEKLFGHYAVVIAARQEFRAMANNAPPHLNQEGSFAEFGMTRFWFIGNLLSRFDFAAHAKMKA
ncbi:MAG TPA: hypothetical protein VIH76_08535 [Candidatus Acidoferrales bacterium]